MNRTQDTIILEKIFNERLELSIYKNRGQFYLTKNLRNVRIYFGETNGGNTKKMQKN